MKFIDKILDILYPDGIKCLVCKSELESNGDFCKDCQKEITFNNKNICQHCGTQIECEGVCPICQSSLLNITIQSHYITKRIICICFI